MSVQDFACNNRVRWKKLTYGRGAFLENLSKCASCKRGRGCRVIDEQTQQISFHVKPDPQSPEYPQVFNRPITSTDIELKARACAKVLLPVLQKERDHCRQPNLIRRPREVSTRAICDTCQAGLFALSWFCPTCGQDFCTDCVEDMCSHSNMVLPPPGISFKTRLTFSILLPRRMPNAFLSQICHIIVLVFGPSLGSSRTSSTNLSKE
ncbi:hypothetical protein PILCRDRAFT_544238 [Piloderma croceum F 1598]|uniref:Uncharacterized protein n=1 Tax=Piloderma croceum (strain F 1598) TaxID=765440 RepID=A0A0C3FJP3_PILCF|nr:hypothetical protein PILCRDRAFT_544238 [Piloderma croceum F 1598]